MTNLDHFIRTYRNYDLLIDTNILILIMVGSANEGFIQKVKPTRKYNRADYEFVLQLTKHFRLVTTPHILAEASNLCEKIEKFYQQKIMLSFKETVAHLVELNVPSIIATTTPVFLKLGLTDSVVHYLGKTGTVVLTEDLNLYSYLFSTGVATVNLNHLQSEFILGKR